MPVVIYLHIKPTPFFVLRLSKDLKLKHFSYSAFSKDAEESVRSHFTCPPWNFKGWK